jgi:hypothetical protein
MPTATQLTTDAHDTDDSEFIGLPGGLGHGCKIHALPSQRCTSVSPEPWLSPTAVHAAAIDRSPNVAAVAAAIWSTLQARETGPTNISAAILLRAANTITWTLAKKRSPLRASVTAGR